MSGIDNPEKLAFMMSSMTDAIENVIQEQFGHKPFIVLLIDPTPHDMGGDHEVGAMSNAPPEIACAMMTVAAESLQTVVDTTGMTKQ